MSAKTANFIFIVWISESELSRLLSSRGRNGFRFYSELSLSLSESKNLEIEGSLDEPCRGDAENDERASLQDGPPVDRRVPGEECKRQKEQHDRELPDLDTDVEAEQAVHEARAIQLK